ncbi:hypothetical protein BCR33DRAFT_788407 [Rhizoclosmatium globosum]|uniref:ABC-type glycine betaine transport system substrate-binding domain-containing protein n=1 Tax=Rhizoclosmatium globosum TaxID=329046 RepID=A0A1Y2BXB7_9FUNG|nr:hypothetical protein BCR33DRAFT_788407 [Rhizoclosmatium globosum]|eukprot:ORY39401.1 hypothetical protein BCR33DRAFT_788407 [Rhizoclosmatium globosum]
MCLASSRYIQKEAINWTAFNVDSNNGQFYNAPDTCVLPYSAWKDLKYVDGTSYTGSKRPIVLLFDAKNSSILTTVQVVTRLQYIMGPELLSNVVDLELEIWQGDFPNMNQLTSAGTIVSIGNTGYNGNFGWFIPNYLVNTYSDFSMDFWRFLTKADQLSAAGITLSGQGPRTLINNLPVCDKARGICTNGTYIPKTCNSKGAQCFELWHYDPSLASAIYQRLIDGLKLPVTINFLGINQAQDIIQNAINQKKPVMFFGWTPSSIVSGNDLTRVMFPMNNAQQYNALRKNKTSTMLTTDTAPTQIKKIASTQFMSDFPDLNGFVNQIRIGDDDMTTMMKSMFVNNWTPAQAACDWINTTFNSPQKQGKLPGGYGGGYNNWLPIPPKSESKSRHV